MDAIEDDIAVLELLDDSASAGLTYVLLQILGGLLSETSLTTELANVCRVLTFELRE